jgi:hypothetical protein
MCESVGSSGQRDAPARYLELFPFYGAPSSGAARPSSAGKVPIRFGLPALCASLPDHTTQHVPGRAGRGGRGAADLSRRRFKRARTHARAPRGCVGARPAPPGSALVSSAGRAESGDGGARRGGGSEVGGRAGAPEERRKHLAPTAPHRAHTPAHAHTRTNTPARSIGRKSGWGISSQPVPTRRICRAPPDRMASDIAFRQEDPPEGG